MGQQFVYILLDLKPMSSNVVYVRSGDSCVWQSSMGQFPDDMITSIYLSFCHAWTLHCHAWSLHGMIIYSKAPLGVISRSVLHQRRAHINVAFGKRIAQTPTKRQSVDC